MDEERRDVLALLQEQSRAKAAEAAARAEGRTSSPFATQRSPIRSMLDIGDAPSVSRRASAGNGSPSSTRAPVRSMLDISSPPLSPPPVRSMLDVNGNANGKAHVTASIKSAHTSPTEAHHKAPVSKSGHPRSFSDAATRPAGFGHRSSVGKKEDAYQFSGYLPTNVGAVMPKRSGKKPSIPSAMSEAIRGTDLSLFGSRDRGRNSITSTGIGAGSSKSKSPHNRFDLRSSSPAQGSDSDLVLDNGTVIDSNNAWRKLSDAHLAKSKGGLSVLAEQGRRRRLGSKDGEGPSGSRLTTADGEDAFSSDDDPGSFSDEERRGRKKSAGKSGDNENTTLGMGRAKGPRTALSLMAAAEEEREYPLLVRKASS